MLTWPQNAGNPISEDHSFNFFEGVNIFLNPLKGTTFSGLDMTTTFSKILYILPRRFTATWNQFALYSMGTRLYASALQLITRKKSSTYQRHLKNSPYKAVPKSTIHIRTFLRQVTSIPYSSGKRCRCNTDREMINLLFGCEILSET